MNRKRESVRVSVGREKDNFRRCLCLVGVKLEDIKKDVYIENLI